MQGLSAWLGEIRRACCEEDIELRFRQALSDFDVIAFNYGAGRIFAPEGPVVDRLWSNMDPAWIAHYQAKNYHRWDRLVHEAFRRTSAFTFDEVFSTPPHTPEQREMESEFPYRNGVVIPIHSPMHRFGIVSAAFHEPLLGSGDAGSEFVARLVLLAGAMHERAETIAAEIAARRSGLSDREVECLVWAAAGKTSEEIALILGITERTVRKHIGTSMSKLGVTTRSQAVAKALAAGLIRI